LPYVSLWFIGPAIGLAALLLSNRHAFADAVGLTIVGAFFLSDGAALSFNLAGTTDHVVSMLSRPRQSVFLGHMPRWFWHLLGACLMFMGGISLGVGLKYAL
jgi:hypothetical protein